MSQRIRVVIVDDSALMRRVLKELLEQDAAISVVGTASNGQEAITLVQSLRPDVVTMDVRMPVMDGLAATEHLMAYCPTPILVLTASLARYEMDITFKMLEAGALEVIEKPAASSTRALEQAGGDLVQRVKLLSRVKVVTHLRGRRKQSRPHVYQPADIAPPRPAPITRAPVATHADLHAFPVIVIGASTGGPRVVYQILSVLPANLRAAVVVVQHIAAGFSGGMAEWLATGCQLPVRLASEGLPLRTGEVLIAPDQRDLLISRIGRTHLSEVRAHLQHTMIDLTMQTAAEAFGARTIGVLLTGMGRDGAEGMRAIQQRGGMTIAQDEATSTIFGMPRAAKELGAVEEMLPAGAIAARLIALVQERSQAVVN